ncbi:hypothetical protein D9M68_919880 [compost metagenome]
MQTTVFRDWFRVFNISIHTPSRAVLIAILIQRVVQVCCRIVSIDCIEIAVTLITVSRIVHTYIERATLFLEAVEIHQHIVEVVPVQFRRIIVFCRIRNTVIKRIGTTQHIRCTVVLLE